MQPNNPRTTLETALEITARAQPPIRKIKKKMEFSKKLMVFTSVIFAATWAFAVCAWLAGGAIPWELVEFVNWLYGATFVSYCGKSAYENKYKIETGRGENG